jgi:hypothetical protein
MPPCMRTRCTHQQGKASFYKVVFDEPGSISIYACLVEEYSNRVISEKIIFLEDPK